MNQARLERLIDDAASGRKYGLQRAMNSSRVNCSGMLPRCACNTRTRLASLGAPSISSTFQNAMAAVSTILFDDERPVGSKPSRERGKEFRH